jgi:lysophospholipase L1-like esterase
MGKKDYCSHPFERMVVLGESTVAGGAWLPRIEDRWADVLASLINKCQQKPVEYHNKGIGANSISPRSPGYEASAKPSALERYQNDVIALKPDLFILCYGLNDMRAGMNVEDFREDMQTIIEDVNGWRKSLSCSSKLIYVNIRLFQLYDFQLS